MRVRVERGVSDLPSEDHCTLFQYRIIDDIWFNEKIHPKLSSYFLVCIGCNAQTGIFRVSVAIMFRQV